MGDRLRITVESQSGCSTNHFAPTHYASYNGGNALTSGYIANGGYGLYGNEDEDGDDDEQESDYYDDDNELEDRLWDADPDALKDKLSSKCRSNGLLRHIMNRVLDEIDHDRRASEF